MTTKRALDVAVGDVVLISGIPRTIIRVEANMALVWMAPPFEGEEPVEQSYGCGGDSPIEYPEDSPEE